MSLVVKKILILALGGEGGGTLTEWVVEAGRAHGWPIQSTSIPGVAQRTGATSYYVECVAIPAGEGTAVPPMCLAPVAGDLDLIISSELLETARAIERGLATPERTLVISSSARALTVDERSAMGEGRWSQDVLESALSGMARELRMVDLGALARREGTIVSAVMFGALAASGVLPFQREVCERIIAGEAGEARAAGSLRGFAAGYEAIREGRAPGPSDVLPVAAHGDEGKGTDELAQIVKLGMERLRDYQDEAYAAQYRTRVDGFAKKDRAPLVATREAARGLALWMTYEDVIRVADLKSRRARFEEIRRDYQVKPGQPLIVRDFLKPGVAELADILPPGLAQGLMRWHGKRRAPSGGDGIALNTSSVSGLLGMRMLSGLRFLRRRSSRFHKEQALVARWAAALEGALEADVRLAGAVARLPRLIKGYGETSARGRGNVLHILEALIEPGLEAARHSAAHAESLAGRVDAAMKTALADPEGRELLRQLGLAQLAPKEHVLRFMQPKQRKIPT